METTREITDSWSDDGYVIANVLREAHYSRKNKNYKRRERMLAEKAQRQARLEKVDR